MAHRLTALLLATMIWLCSGACQAQQPTGAQAAPRRLRVLTITGDWKSQPWYQDVWMDSKGERLLRGRFIAREVEKAAPGRFEFTDITNYVGQQYGDAAYFSQFDVILIGDIVGWSLPDRFLKGLQSFVQNGGGFVYAASYKWHNALLDNTPFEAVLPAKFGVDGYTDDWKNADLDPKEQNFKPILAAPGHPIVAGLDWQSVPTLDRAFYIAPKPGAQVLLKTPGGAPILAAWETGRGRAVLSASIFANDEVSSKIGGWQDFGRYYAQLFSWLGAKSSRQPVTLHDATAAVTVNVDAAQTSNSVTAKIFGIHAAHDDPGLAPLSGEALKNFEALNLRGAFSRMGGLADIEPQNDNDDPNTFNWAAYKFERLDTQLAQIQKLGLEPLVLMDLNYGHPEWLWKGTSWSDPSPQAIAEAAELVAAVVEHANGGKGTSPNYKLNVRYIEIANEPDLNAKTIPGFARLFKGVAARIHRDYPGVQVGTFGGYEIPYLQQFLVAANPDLDWVSRHPYGWTGERLFQVQDEMTAFMKAHGLRQIPFIITEWDFWIQGRPKFDYMMLRYYEAVKRDNLLGTLHYRLGQYAEPIYMFGVLWAGWGKEKGAGDKGTPMHDAYDAFWVWRDLRGPRAAVRKSVGANTSAALLDHIHAEATRTTDGVAVVLYQDWAYDGTGFKDYAAGVNYNLTKVTLAMAFPPMPRARTLTSSQATGEGFAVSPQTVTIEAGATHTQQTITLTPLTAVAVTIR